MRPQYYEHDDVWVAVPKPTPLRTLIRSELLNALAYTDGSQRQAAQALGVSPRALNYMLQTYGIPLTHAGTVRTKTGRKPKAMRRASDR